MRPGDGIEVHFRVLEGILVNDVWQGAVVLKVDGHRLLAKALGGPFPNGDAEMFCDERDRGNTWR